MKKIGTIRGKKITPKQQRLFGAARGAQESGRPTFLAAEKVAKSIPAKRLHQASKKPAGGYRRLKK